MIRHPPAIRPRSRRRATRSITAGPATRAARDSVSGFATFDEPASAIVSWPEPSVSIDSATSRSARRRRLRDSCRVPSRRRAPSPCSTSSAARAAGSSRACGPQPLGRLRRTLAERGFLHGFDGKVLAPCRLMFDLGGVERAAAWRSASRSACSDARAASSSACAARPRSRASRSAVGELVRLRAGDTGLELKRSCAIRSRCDFSRCNTASICSMRACSTSAVRVASADSRLNVSQRCCHRAIADSASARLREPPTPLPAPHSIPVPPATGNGSAHRDAPGRARPAHSTRAYSALTRSRSVRWRCRSSRACCNACSVRVVSAPAW